MLKIIFLSILFITFFFPASSQELWETNAKLSLKKLEEGDTISFEKYRNVAFENVFSKNPNITSNNYYILTYVLRDKIKTTDSQEKLSRGIRIYLNLESFLKSAQNIKSSYLIEVYSQLSFFYYYVNNIDSANQYCLLQINFMKGINNWSLDDSIYFARANYLEATILEDKGKYENAYLFYEQSLLIFENIWGELSPDVASSLNNLAEWYRKMGQYEKALPLYEQSLRIFKKIFGEENPSVANSLNNLALLYSEMGEYKKSLPLYEHSLQILKKTLGDESLKFAQCLNGIGSVYFYLGQYRRALPLLEQALVIKKKNLGNQNLDVALSLNNLASLYTKLGQYEKALVLDEQVLEMRIKMLGVDHPDVANSWNSVAVVYSFMGQNDRAISIYEKAIGIQKESFRDGNLDLAQSLNNLAELYSKMGQFEKAIPLYEQALQIRKKTLGNAHPDVAESMNSLAGFYSEIGQFEKALILEEKALAIRQEKIGNENSIVAESLNSLARIYSAMGQYEKALTLDEQALAIRKKILGDDHPDVSESMNNLAGSYCEIGQYGKAIVLYKSTLEISNKTIGIKNNKVANTLNDLGILYYDIGQYKESLLLYEQALDIMEKTLGLEHPNVALCESNMANLFYRVGNINNAIIFKQHTINITNKNISYAMQFITENERDNYMISKNSFYDTFDSFVLKCDSIQISTAENFNNIQFLQNLSLNISGRMREQIELSKDSLLKNQFTKYISLQRLYSQTLTLTVEDRRNRDINLDSLQEEITKSERNLVQRSTSFGNLLDKQNLQFEQIGKVLKPNQAFVQFHSFPFFSRTGWTDSIMYVAYVVRPGIKEPVMIPLLEERSIDSLFFAPDVSSLVTNLYHQRDSKLYNLLWKPLLPALSNASEIFISPSGILHKISFAAISDTSGAYLSDTYILHQVLGAQDFVYPENQSVFSSADTSLQIALFGGIRYDQPSNNTNVTASVKDTLWISSLSLLPKNLDRGSSWGYLPGTEQEVQQIKSLFSQKHLAVESFTGYAATEQQLRQLEGNQSPRILHIATHGFFAPDPKVNFKKKNLELMANENIFRTSDNPLLRSGILMAGANDAWKGNATLPGEEDGVLTAQEVSCMRLNNTQLVVLSACETGLGDIHGREGVYGLQRAFRLAGAKFLLLSLWRIPDKETSEFMQLFYTNLLQINNIPQAYTLARNTMKNRYPEDPLKWAGLVLVE